MSHDPRAPYGRDEYGRPYGPPLHQTRSRPAVRPAVDRYGRPAGQRRPAGARPSRPPQYRQARPVYEPRVYRLGNPARRLQAVTWMAFLLVALLCARLFMLQGVDGRNLALAAENQRLRTTVLQADRGNIVDRNGVVLATDVETNTVAADTKIISDKAKTAARLSPLLRLSEARLVQLLNTVDGNGKPSRYVVLVKGLNTGIGADVSSLKLTGIVVIRDSKRVYPSGQLAAGVLGFMGADTKGDQLVGRGGMELALNSVLAGKDGKSVVETDNAGRQIPGGEKKAQPAVPGRNAVLTIDRDIQWIAQSAIAAQVKATHADGGTALVMDTRTGEILALATVPTFDPNDITRAKIKDLSNPAASDVYEPGSVNKVITAAAALETGVVTPQSVIEVPGRLKVADRIFKDAEEHGTERLTFAGVLARSSNIGTIKVAQKLQPGVLFDYMHKFGFGQTTHSGFPAESPGIIRDLDHWTESDHASIPIGQGIAVTPLQVAQVYATVANGGVRVTPHIVKGSYDANGKFVPYAKVTQTRTIRADTAATLRAMLESVTTVDGTAPAAAIDGYRIAGKTGTANKINEQGTDYSGYISSFVGFAPADDPRLVVAVILDKPRGAYYGGLVAAPVFHDVMSFALQTLRIPPTGKPSATFKLTAP